MDISNRLEKMAQSMRLKALDMALMSQKKGAHLGPAFSCMEILAVLYGEVMNLSPENSENINRDRMIASKAHCVLGHYTALREIGLITDEELDTFQQNGTLFGGHPQKDLKHGLEYTGGSLGMALSVGIGMALDAKRNQRENQIYILLGDGECEEGSNWEAFLSAIHFKLDNLTIIIDNNRLQYDGSPDEIMSLGNLEEKLQAFGFCVDCVDGHDVAALLKAFSNKVSGVPHVIIANTTKGKGVSFMENAREWHHNVLTQTQYEKAIEEIRGWV